MLKNRPWEVLWSPRVAFPALVRQPRWPWLILLVALTGFGDELTKLLSKSVKPEQVQPFGQTLAMYAGFGALVGLLTFWSLPWALNWAVTRLGGRSTPAALRSVLGWAGLPRLLLAVFLF